MTAFCVAVLFAQEAEEAVSRLDVDADFIVSMIADGDGGVFIGTEDKGVVHRDADGNVTRFVAELGDPNAYALAIDKRGRLWVGNLNSGVSVFNGETWKNYDVIDGPIGERVFDIQTCPVDGDVWIATSAGITRYKLDADSWEHFTREDGLLEDQASSLAFTNDGTLIVGTQCHGLAIFTRNKNGAYSHAKNITAPERFGPNNCSPVPLVPFGDGLPTNQINQVLVASDGVIWIATPTGLVRANDKLTQMQFARGIDYADKVRGLYGGAPKDWQECPPEVRTQLLPEDYITCLAEDASGAIWLGTRQRGFVAIDPQT
ncbi:MAG: ligand-binding sensor domain-containing protein, partial [Thermoguttaceae bacterium]